jgi:hypothetical protein
MAKLLESPESSPMAESPQSGHQRERARSVSSYSSNGVGEDSEAESLVEEFDWSQVEPIDPVVVESPRPGDEIPPPTDASGASSSESQNLGKHSVDLYGTIHLKQGALFAADPNQSATAPVSSNCAGVMSLFDHPSEDNSPMTPFSEGRNGGTIKKPDGDKSRPELLADLFTTSDDTPNTKSRQGSLILVNKRECPRPSSFPRRDLLYTRFLTDRRSKRNRPAPGAGETDGGSGKEAD